MSEQRHQHVHGPVDGDSGRRGVTAVRSDFCAVPPSPRLRAAYATRPADGSGPQLTPAPPGLAWSGFDDGTIKPAESYPPDTPRFTVMSAAADRAPLRGPVRVAVVLADFDDRPMGAGRQHFEDLFFSLGVLPKGSVREYFREVTNGLVDIVGEVVGPLRLSRTLAWYANGNSGVGNPEGEPRARTMAEDTARAADPLMDFAPYDNDGNGFVDAFIVVHAGTGGETSGDGGDLWSHKWLLPSAYDADGTRIYAYLTIPEDARIGVAAHELGHLVFGFPDLYDTDGSSEGVGDWCLMAGGAWGGDGDVPVHPSAWCKVRQGWASETVVTDGGAVSFEEMKTSRTAHRLWTGGAVGSEYFLVENRQRTGYDESLPAGGLLVWHVDESRQDNADESRYKVRLVQADALGDLEGARNRGDAGDPFPGSENNTALTAESKPGSQTYAGRDSGVSLTGISASGPVMTATVSVTAPAAPDSSAAPAGPEAGAPPAVPVVPAASPAPAGESLSAAGTSVAPGV
ncbi:M6 family metalloprotease domain-containing protein [Streptomyces sp. NPDC020875]|uniref:M6 family metalloprotease domain-containing protein n=1 Tax=Streptomyces sp. NPDC020875 TaxID=3154898 RepID=UPI0033CE731F